REPRTTQPSTPTVREHPAQRQSTTGSMAIQKDERKDEKTRTNCRCTIRCAAPSDQSRNTTFQTALMRRSRERSPTKAIDMRPASILQSTDSYVRKLPFRREGQSHQ